MDNKSAICPVFVSNSQTQHFEGAGRYHTSEKIWYPPCLPALSVTGEPGLVRSRALSCVMRDVSCVMTGSAWVASGNHGALTDLIDTKTFTEFPHSDISKLKLSW